jgi:hypothetical protein
MTNVAALAAASAKPLPRQRARRFTEAPLQLTPALPISLCLCRPLARSRRCAQWSAKYACRQIAHGRALKLPGGPPRAFLATVAGVAEQSRHCFPSTKKVHLKSMRLFLGAWLGVDATDVLLRVGISSFFHGLVPDEPL